ncbi:MAG: hypothetical protein K0U39_05075 [Alphaproteobacteria bacterium]|nr:hypothetical protein [Alphaproteobacteria bacterium]
MSDSNIAKQVASKQEESPKLSLSDEDSLMAQRELVELKGREAFFKLRKNWSWFIFSWITGLILFHAILTLLLGLGYMDFQKHKNFLPMIIIEHFLQIVGMGYVVVKFLYPHNQK